MLIIRKQSSFKSFFLIKILIDILAEIRKHQYGGCPVNTKLEKSDQFIIQHFNVIDKKHPVRTAFLKICVCV